MLAVFEVKTLERLDPEIVGLFESQIASYFRTFHPDFVVFLTQTKGALIERSSHGHREDPVFFDTGSILSEYFPHEQDGPLTHNALQFTYFNWLNQLAKGDEKAILATPPSVRTKMARELESGLVELGRAA